jgi:hypothetical protein
MSSALNWLSASARQRIGAAGQPFHGSERVLLEDLSQVSNGEPVRVTAAAATGEVGDERRRTAGPEFDKSSK